MSRVWLTLVIVTCVLVACSAPTAPSPTPGAAVATTDEVMGTTAEARTTPMPAGTPVESGVPAGIAGTVWGDECTPGGVADPSSSAPPSSCIAETGGGYQGNGVKDTSDPSIAGVQVTLGAGACPAAGLATALTDGKGEYAFGDLGAGTYCVTVDADAAENSAVLAAGVWTEPATDRVAAARTVTLKANERRGDVDFGWDFRPEPAARAGLTPGDGECTYRVTFVADVTIPDDSVVAAGTALAKTWRLRNDGTCTWGPTGYALDAAAFVSGDRLGAPAQVALPAVVRPGSTVDVSVNMTAPSAPGTYTSNWKLRVKSPQPDDPNAVKYVGLGYTGEYPFFARIVVTAVERVNFAQGATRAEVAGTLRAGQARTYALRAQKDQALLLGLAPAGSVRITVQGANGQAPATVRVAADGGSWVYQLPATQDYLITVTAGAQEARYTLAIDVPARISFPADANSATVNGATAQRRPVAYILRARAGQTLSVTAQGANGAGLTLTVYGLQDGSVLVRGAGGGGDGGGTARWSGLLPATQDYVIQVTPATDSLVFTLNVSVR